MLAVDPQVWDDVVAGADAAWFWHLRSWAEFVREVTGPALLADASFLLTVGTEAVAACPVFVESGPDGPELSMLRSPLPMPALKSNLDPGIRDRIAGDYVAQLRQIAATHGAVRVSLREPFARRTHDGGGGLQPWELWRFGFSDASLLTQLVDLSRPLDALWTEVRKGHRSDVKRARELCDVVVWDHETLQPETFAAYQALHAKDAGRVTRSQRSFDLMREWILEGRAVLVEARADGSSVAFAVVMIFGGRAYYGSGCQDPERTRLGASHLVQWTIIEWLRGHQVHTYDVGLQHFSPRWHSVPSDKDRSIATFKRGFGGQVRPLHVVEAFYAADARRAATLRRLEAQA